MIEFETRSETSLDQKPFVIRGHHLEDYQQATMSRDVSRLAKIMKNNILLLWQQSRYNIQSRSVKYAIDVIGSWHQADKFEEQYKIALKTFLQLPGNYPTEITEGIPDKICEGCVIGKHCRRLFTDEYVSKSIFKNDEEYIETFLEGLNSLNLPKPVIAYGQAYFSDAEPQEARRVRTTADVVRKVLKATNFIAKIYH